MQREGTELGKGGGRGNSWCRWRGWWQVVMDLGQKGCGAEWTSDVVGCWDGWSDVGVLGWAAWEQYL